MVRNSAALPHAMLQNIRHNRVLHERVILLAMRTESAAYVSDEDRVHVETLAPGLYRVVARHGFAEDADVRAVLARLGSHGLKVDVATSTFFLGRETLIATNRPGMAMWRERLFARLARNAQRATKFFRIPPERVCELGTQIEL
jgi:KUP system potassium uptake protein